MTRKKKALLLIVLILAAAAVQLFVYFGERSMMPEGSQAPVLQNFIYSDKGQRIDFELSDEEARTVISILKEGRMRRNLFTPKSGEADEVVTAVVYFRDGSEEYPLIFMIGKDPSSSSADCPRYRSMSSAGWNISNSSELHEKLMEIIAPYI